MARAADGDVAVFGERRSVRCSGMPWAAIGGASVFGALPDGGAPAFGGLPMAVPLYLV